MLVSISQDLIEVAIVPIPLKQELTTRFVDFPVSCVRASTSSVIPQSNTWMFGVSDVSRALCEMFKFSAEFKRRLRIVSETSNVACAAERSLSKFHET
jgi:hypothetical protein